MWTPERITEFSKVFGFNPATAKTEVKELPNLINAEEELHGLASGIITSINNRKNLGSGIIILTNKRVIFYRKSFIGITTQEDIALTRISSASYRKGLLSGSIVITSASNEAIFSFFDKKLGQKFEYAISNLLDRHMNTIENKPQNNSSDLSAKLEKLFELKQKGILTEDEFQQQKAKILL